MNFRITIDNVKFSDVKDTITDTVADVPELQGVADDGTCTVEFELKDNCGYDLLTIIRRAGVNPVLTVKNTAINGVFATVRYYL